MSATDLQNAYLDYANNYPTVEVYAEHHGLLVGEAKTFLAFAKQIHERIVMDGHVAINICLTLGAP